MNFVKPDTIKGQTILVVGIGMFLFSIVSLVLYIFFLNIIPSLIIMAIATLMFTIWAMNKPLKSLSGFAKASEDMNTNIQAARPIKEEGPKEIRDAIRSFNLMQSRVQQLLDGRNHMLGALSHDFRTLLTRLRLRIESIKEKEQHDKAASDLDEMDMMITQTLHHARDESIEESRELLELDIVIRDIAHDLETQNGNITLSLDHNIELMCQPIGIRRVLRNIICNGLFYSQHVHITLRKLHGAAVIEVDDDGPGIEVQQRNKVFTPFYRIESSRNRQTGGIGLGLSIAQTIIRAHGGTIELLDSPMGGLRVSISLPFNRENTFYKE